MLDVERSSEELQSLAARGSCSPKEQEAAGLALRRMNIAAVEHGAGGRVYLRFEKYMQQARCSKRSIAAHCNPPNSLSLPSPLPSPTLSPCPPINLDPEMSSR